MKKLRGIVCLLLACLLLCGCTAGNEPQGSGERDKENLLKIAYVPLDDRPNNAECMEYLAQSLGYELTVPERDLYATKLNNQPLNANGTPCGDRAAIYEWLLAQENSGCDRYIIFVDQLLSGGLVNSRAMSENESVTLSDGSVLTESELLKDVIELLGGDENNRVYLLDTVMRLAPTVGYKEWTKEDYTNVREWACVPRNECELSPDAITESYRTDVDGNEILPADYDVSEETLSLYLAARERKMQLGCELLDEVGSSENVSILMGIDDSSEENCIQKNEIEYFESRLRENDALLSGVDDMGYKALARLYLDETGWQGSAAEVKYFGENEDIPASAYDFRPLNEVIDAHFEYFDLRKSDDAELCFMVLTAPKDEAQKEKYLADFLDGINEAFEQKKAVVLMDASNCAYGDELRNALIEDTELGRLVAYAGTLDLANLTGVALSHGISRYALLKNGVETEYTKQGFELCMADVLVKDLCYRTLVRAETAQLVRDMGGNPDNFCDPAVDVNAVMDFTAERMDKVTKPVLKNLSRSSLISSLAPYAESDWDGVKIADYEFSWLRTFELAVFFELK